MIKNLHAEEVARGNRFEFGENWSNFISVLDDESIVQAKESLIKMIGLKDLVGKNFIDVGSGSGLFSLAARMLGANVYSFDFDPKSVACTKELRRQYYPKDLNWFIEEGSVLNDEYLNKIGQFDIVYSWGVLHHTGDLWRAISNTGSLVKKGGVLYISLYNDQGGKSHRWKIVKRMYCSGLIGKIIIKLIFYPYFGLGRLTSDVLKRKNPLKSYSEYKKNRGMSVIHDWNDWLGGYPFEVSKPEEIFDFFVQRKFILKKLKTCGGGLGCNEYIFTFLGN